MALWWSALLHRDSFGFKSPGEFPNLTSGVSVSGCMSVFPMSPLKEKSVED